MSILSVLVNIIDIDAGLGDSDFRVLEALLHKGPLPVNTIGRRVWLMPGSISVAVDQLERKALVKRKSTDDRRLRLFELKEGAHSSRMFFWNTRREWNMRLVSFPTKSDWPY